jgi:4-amino-4-deoxy-L-arabinose transferase-like glycosyltransferase
VTPAAALIVLALAIVAKGLTWAVTIPPFDVPDEPAHYSYAQLLGLSFKLPVTAANNDYSPDIKALFAATLTDVTPGSIRVRLYPERAGSGPVGPREGEVGRAPVVPAPDTPSAPYGPATYTLFAVAIAVFQGHGIVAQLMAARVIAVLLGMVAALATAWAAREADLGWPLALSAAVVVGYQPIFSQQTAGVSTDAGLFAFSALAFALAVRQAVRPGTWTAVGLGTTIGLALLSKPAAAFLAPLLLVLLLPLGRRGRPSERRVRTLAVGAAAAFIALVPFLAWNHFHQNIIAHLAAGGTRDYLKLLFGPGNGYLYAQTDSFWGNFGWYERALPQWILNLCRWLDLVLAALALLGVVRSRGRLQAVAALGVVMFLGCAAIAFGFDFLLWRYQRGLGLQGRYFLPGFPMLVVAVMAGVNALGARLRLAGAVTLATIVIGLNCASLLTLWKGIYAT